MPSRGSWNNRWSGEDKLYVKVMKFNKSDIERYKLKDKLNKDFYYRWDDEWCACVDVMPVDSKEASYIRKHSAGFMGYDWMIDSILQNGVIKTPQRSN
jgi:hypothetical protein